MNKIYISIIFLLFTATTFSQDDPDAPVVNPSSLKVQGEEDYYPIITLPVPEDVLIEAGGVSMSNDGRLAVVTRRGDVFLIENPASFANGVSHYILFAQGLHEPLGCAWKGDALYVAQRGELTKLMDTNGDGRADVYETVYAWPLSGNYHEYSFGPAIGEDGSFYVTANVGFFSEEWWRGLSKVPMRGWTMRITEDGKMEPWATGMRSPAGYGIYDGELFYDDNQGDWMGSGGIWHVKKGSFVGHPAGLNWANESNSPVKGINLDSLSKYAPPRQEKNKYGNYIKPENIEKEKGTPLYEMKAKFPAIQTPAVWLPHGILGISNSEIKEDRSAGKFGPFAGQLFVGDQGQSKVMRVALEKINGEYQGVAFDFRAGFQSGVLRMDWGHDGSLYVGETNRGWGSAGEKNEGLQRVIWSGKMPFEMKTVKAMPDGFEIEFTKPADVKTLKDLANFEVSSFIYKYHPVYGSPPINNETLKCDGLSVSEDGLKVRLVFSNLKKYYVHKLYLPGVTDKEGNPLLHAVGYYTLNNIPEGPMLDKKTLITYNSAKAATKSGTKKKSTTTKSTSTNSTKTSTTIKSTAATFEEVKPLLIKHTCTSCHNPNKRLIGPSYKDIAKRNYSNEQIAALIKKPNPKNWPGYATEMAPMPQVPKADALKIAGWINTLR